MVHFSISRRCAVLTAWAVAAVAAGRVAPVAQAQTAEIAARRGPVVARIELAPPAKEKLLVGETMPLQVTAYDEANQPIARPRIAFRVTPPAVARVVRGSLVPMHAGEAEIVAVSGRVVSDPIRVIVNQVGRIDVTPGPYLEINAGDTLVFQAQCYDVYGNPLPNEEYPEVPLVWRTSSRLTPITRGGALITRRMGRAIVYATVGRTRSLPVRVMIRRRQEARSTRVFLTGQPLAGVQSFCVTIDKMEIANEAGAWHTLLTGHQIDALVGQPIDIQRLHNLRIQLGTAWLPEGEYRRMRITFSSQEDANYLIRADGVRVPLRWRSPEAAVREFSFYLFVTYGYPMNAVLDLLSPQSIETDEERNVWLVPRFDWLPMDDEELAQPFGSLVGQINRTTGVLVYATNFDTGGTIRNYFATIDRNTGVFRIGQLPSGYYTLKVARQGVQHDLQITTFRAVPGQDVLLPQPILLE